LAFCFILCCVVNPSTALHTRPAIFQHQHVIPHQCFKSTRYLPCNSMQRRCRPTHRQQRTGLRGGSGSITASMLSALASVPPNALIAAGVVGIVLGLLGGGGSILAVPIFLVVLGHPPKVPTASSSEDFLKKTIHSSNESPGSHAASTSRLVLVGEQARHIFCALSTAATRRRAPRQIAIWLIGVELQISSAAINYHRKTMIFTVSGNSNCRGRSPLRRRLLWCRWARPSAARRTSPRATSASASPCPSRSAPW
jgi:hypothetical protein